MLYQAEQILTGECMRQHGFQYWPIPYGGQVSPASQGYPYLVMSISWAARNGFGNDSLTHAGPDPNQQYVDHLSAARQAAYGLALFGLSPNGPQVRVAIPQGGVIGHSTDGCQASAEGTLYGNFREWFQASTIMGNLELASQSQVTNDPEYKGAVTRW